jgi:hypothetical protein
MSKDTLPDTLTFCIASGSIHERRSNAERLLINTLKACDVDSTRDDWTVQMFPNEAVFSRKVRL